MLAESACGEQAPESLNLSMPRVESWSALEAWKCRYGHLMPGNEAEAAGLLDAYLAASS